MAQTLKLKRGNNANLGSLNLEAGEPAFVLDTGKLYVGNGTDKVLINPDVGTAAKANTGTASGNVPVLDANGKLNSSVLPAIAVTDTFVVATEAAMLALTVEVGDVAVRTDLNKSFILKTAGASTLANWQELLTPTDAVQSVNGKKGTVSLTATDVGAEPTIPTGTASQIILGNKSLGTLPTSNANHTGDVTGSTALTIAANAVTNAKLAKMPTANTLKGTLTANADPADLTAAQVKTMLGCLDASSTIDGGTF